MEVRAPKTDPNLGGGRPVKTDPGFDAGAVEQERDLIETLLPEVDKVSPAPRKPSGPIEVKPEPTPAWKQKSEKQAPPPTTTPGLSRKTLVLVAILLGLIIGAANFCYIPLGVPEGEAAAKELTGFLDHYFILLLLLLAVVLAIALGYLAFRRRHRGFGQPVAWGEDVAPVSAARAERVSAESSVVLPGKVGGATAEEVTLGALQVAEAEVRDATAMILGSHPAVEGSSLVQRMLDGWDARDESRHFAGHADAVWRVAASPDGRHLLSAGMDSTLRLWEIGSGQLIRSFEGHASGCTGVVFVPDGRSAISGSLDGTLRVWEVETGKERLRLGEPTDQIFGLALSPDGRCALSGVADRTARLWDVATGQELARLEGHTDWVNAVAFSPDGRHVVSASEDGTARLWDLHSGDTRRLLEGHAGAVKCATWSPCGRFVITGGEDGTARLWRAETGEELWQFAGHTDWIRCVGFSPRGDLVVTGSDDETLCLLRTDSGIEVGHLKVPGCSLLSATFTPDGLNLLAGGDDGLIRLWPLSTIYCIPA
jgi:hypothetical protein